MYSKGKNLLHTTQNSSFKNSLFRDKSDAKIYNYIFIQEI